MGYRGDDLDLRTPQATSGDYAFGQPGDPFAATMRPRPQAQETNRPSPIWVDETVLACCNHAFDVALAHRAAEVRLEHLIYALTRIEEASDALEIRGIRVTALRREAATAIATEIPAVLGKGKATPRRADALVEVLRLAAAHAYRRQAPVSIADIMIVLFDSGAEFAAIHRLLPALPRLMAPPQPDLRNIEAIRELVRESAGAGLPPRGLTSDHANLSASEAYTQQSRIDALEQSIRSLTTELANERKNISGVLQDLQREIMAHRDDTTRLGGLSQDKIQTAFGDRLQSLEQAYLTSRNPIGLDQGPLQDRLAMLERALVSEMSATRAAIEALISRPAPDFGSLVHRIEVIEEAVLSTETSERLKALEQAVAVLSASIEPLAQTLANQPAEISALVSSPLIEHLNALSVTRESQHAAVSDRLGALDAALTSHVGRAEEAASVNAENLDALRDSVSSLTNSFEDAFGKFAETLSQDMGDVHESLGKVNTNQLTLATTLDTQGQETVAAFSGITGRIESLERAAAKPVEMLQGLSATVDKMHKITVEKYYRRNRFWYWLFGTDDWLAASWPSQSARIAEELRAIKH